MLNKILEHHIVGAHALPHEVSTYIYIYIYIDDKLLGTLGDWYGIR